MSAYPVFNVDYYDNFRELLLGISEKHADRPAVTWYTRRGEEQTRSYGRLGRDALCFGEALCLAGLQGEHIAIASENSYEWIYAFLGITASGSVAVCVDVEQSEQAILDMILRADVKMLVASASVAPLLAPALLRSGVRIVVIGDCPEMQSIEQFCAAGRERVRAGGRDALKTKISKNQVAAIAFTSGTTSLPKPVMLSHYGLVTNASESIAMVTPTPKVFSSLPFYHTYGLTCGVMCILISGANLGINGDMKRMGRDLMAFDPQIMFAVPLMVEMLHKKLMAGVEQAGKRRQVDKLLKLNAFLHRMGIRRPYRQLVEAKKRGMGQLETIICGGAHLSRTVAQNLLAFGVLVLEGYGITECSPLISVNRKHSYEISSVGHLLPSFELKLHDGEIWVRGPSVMLGYYEDEQATKQVLENGWFKTGDVGHYSRKKFLYITGRKKNLIVLKNGKKIAPEEIEAYLKELAMVREVVAYGAPNGSSADDVKLAVVVYPEHAQCEGMSDYEILEHLQQQVEQVNRKLPAYKQIQMVNLRSDEFEKTASQKIKR